MVFGVFYKDGLKHRGLTKITRLSYPLKLLVFMALLTGGIVVVLRVFDGLRR
jgi:hypothetical protein